LAKFGPALVPTAAVVITASVLYVSCLLLALTFDLQLLYAVPQINTQKCVADIVLLFYVYPSLLSKTSENVLLKLGTLLHYVFDAFCFFSV